MKFTFEADGDRESVLNEIATQMKSAGRQNQDVWPVISVVRDHVNQKIAAIEPKKGDKVALTVDIEIALVYERAAREAETVTAN